MMKTASFYMMSSRPYILAYSILPSKIIINPYSAGTDSESDVYRRQILTSKVDPHTARVKNIYNGRRPVTYSNGSVRRPNQDMYN